MQEIRFTSRPPRPPRGCGYIVRGQSTSRYLLASPPRVLVLKPQVRSGLMPCRTMTSTASCRTIRNQSSCSECHCDRPIDKGEENRPDSLHVVCMRRKFATRLRQGRETHASRFQSGAPSSSPYSREALLLRPEIDSRLQQKTKILHLLACKGGHGESIPGKNSYEQIQQIQHRCL